jgi:Fic family protein
MLVAQIHEYKGRQNLFLQQQPEALKRLVDIAKVQSTEASNKIEGIVTTHARLKQLYETKTTPRNRDEKEIMGYRDVLNTIHDHYAYIPLTSSYILQLHRDLYKYSAMALGGRFKNAQNVITETLPTGEQIIRFKPLEPYETPGAIASLCDAFNRAMDQCTIDPLLLIPIFINDFLCIHPFSDGNGRMSRLLTTLLLYRSGYVVGRYISLEQKIEQTKHAYYEALAKSGQGWHEATHDPKAFITYFLNILCAAYVDFETRISLVETKGVALDLVRKAVLDRMGRFTKHDLELAIPTLRKSSIGNALKVLVEEGTLERFGQGKSTFYFRRG